MRCDALESHEISVNHREMYYMYHPEIYQMCLQHQSTRYLQIDEVR